MELMEMLMLALWCLAAVLCYRQGLADGGSLAQKGQLDRQPRQDKEQNSLRRLMHQIDHYDGRTREGGR